MILAVSASALFLFLQASSGVATFNVGQYEFESQAAFLKAGKRCGVKDLTPEEAEIVESAFQQDMHTEGVMMDGERRKPFTPQNIDVFFHVITDSNNNGVLDPAVLDDQVGLLNDFFGPSGFTFTIIGAELIQDNAFFTLAMGSEAEYVLKNTRHIGIARTLNLYTADLVGGLLGWATFPNEYKKTPSMDGVIVRYDTLPGVLEGGPYSLGMTAVHEVGHWLGLYHPFQGGCTAVYRGGDWVMDTNPENPNEEDMAGCPEARDSCVGTKFPGTDPVHNIMDYSDDYCLNDVTDGQTTRMQLQWMTYRNRPYTGPILPARK